MTNQVSPCYDSPRSTSGTQQAPSLTLSACPQRAALPPLFTKYSDPKLKTDRGKTPSRSHLREGVLLSTHNAVTTPHFRVISAAQSKNCSSLLRFRFKNVM